MSIRLFATLSLGLLGFWAVVPALAAPGETFLSGFNGDLSSSVGLDWTAVSIDPVTDLSFGTDGVTEGSESLTVLHNQTWTHSLQLDGYQLLQSVASHDKFELDVTVDGFNADWRQLFLIMQGTELSWSQVSVDLDVGTGFDPFVTTNVVIDLTDPQGDGSQNWQQAAKDSILNTENQWWQIHLVFQGNDLTGEEKIPTIIDNLRFTGGPNADFNNDTFVDGQDLGTWQTSYGVDAGADADGDGDSDGNDFMVWQRQHTGPPPAIAAVPEPSTFAVLASALALTSMVSRSRRS